MFACHLLAGDPDFGKICKTMNPSTCTIVSQSGPYRMGLIAGHGEFAATYGAANLCNMTPGLVGGLFAPSFESTGTSVVGVYDLPKALTGVSSFSAPRLCSRVRLGSPAQHPHPALLPRLRA